MEAFDSIGVRYFVADPGGAGLGKNSPALTERGHNKSENVYDPCKTNLADTEVGGSKGGTDVGKSLV